MTNNIYILTKNLCAWSGRVCCPLPPLIVVRSELESGLLDYYSLLCVALLGLYYLFYLFAVDAKNRRSISHAFCICMHASQAPIQSLAKQQLGSNMDSILMCRMIK